MPPGIRPPGTEFLQMPPQAGPTFLPPPGTYVVPPSGQPQQRLEDGEEVHGDSQPRFGP